MEICALLTQLLPLLFVRVSARDLEEITGNEISENISECRDSKECEFKTVTNQLILNKVSILNTNLYGVNKNNDFTSELDEKFSQFVTSKGRNGTSKINNNTNRQTGSVVQDVQAASTRTKKDRREVVESSRDEPRGLISLFKKSMSRNNPTTVRMPPPFVNHGGFNQQSNRFSTDPFRNDPFFRQDPAAMFPSMRKSSGPPVFVPGTGASYYPPASAYYSNFPSSKGSFNYRNKIKNKSPSTDSSGQQPIHVHLDIYPRFDAVNKNGGQTSKFSYSPPPDRTFLSDSRQSSFSNFPSSSFNSQSSKVDSFSSDESIDTFGSSGGNKQEIVLHLNFFPRKDQGSSEKGAELGGGGGGWNRRMDTLQPTATIRRPNNSNKHSRVSYVVPIPADDFNPEIYDRGYGIDRIDRGGAAGYYNTDHEFDDHLSDEWTFLPDPERFTQNSTSEEPDVMTTTETPTTSTTSLPPLPTPVE